MSCTEDRLKLIAEIKRIRAEGAAECERLVDAHILKHYGDHPENSFALHGERCSIEVDTWPAWKRCL